MKRSLICGLAFSWMSALVFPVTATAAPFAYVINTRSNNVSVIDTATETVGDRGRCREICLLESLETTVV